MTQVAVLLERPSDDAVQLVRQLGIDPHGSRGHPVENAVEDHGRRPASERLPSGSHLVEHGAEREEIGAMVHVLAPRLLRRHVRHRPQRGAGTGQVDVVRGPRRFVWRRSGPRRGRHLGQPEVEDLGVAPGRHEDVGRLDVAVHDALHVRGIEGVRQLRPEVEDALGAQGAPADARPQRLALEQLHHQEVAAVMLANVVNRADVRVVERRGGARLPAEPGDRLLVLGERLRQELECHLPAEPRVLGPIDLAHATLADLGGDSIRAERRAGVQRHGLAPTSGTDRVMIRALTRGRARPQPRRSWL